MVGGRKEEAGGSGRGLEGGEERSSPPSFAVCQALMIHFTAIVDFGFDNILFFFKKSFLSFAHSLSCPRSKARYVDASDFEVNGSALEGG